MGTPPVSRYYDKTAFDAEMRAGLHRESVGGSWDEIGQLQLDFLMAHGLMPHIDCSTSVAAAFERV